MKIFGIIAAVCIIAVAVVNVYNSQPQNMELPTLVLANVEALADGGEYPASPNPESKCKGGPYMCYMGQGNVWGKN